MNLRLCNSAQKLMTYTSKASFRKTTKIDDDLIAVLMNKDIVCLDRPSYIGQTVLDLSKLRMYQLQYIELEKYRKEENCEINIVAGDTDSFVLEIKNIKLEKTNRINEGGSAIGYIELQHRPSPLQQQFKFSNWKVQG